jgi:GNAT superfamily N-acetyltransferase
VHPAISATGKEIPMTVDSYTGASHTEAPRLTIRPAKGFDAPAVAELRSLCSTGNPSTPAFMQSMRTWLQAEGEPRITLMAVAEDRPVGLISMLEHRGMPEPGAPWSRWGYIGHLFVRDGDRRQGVGGALIAETVEIADRRDYEKLLVSPGSMALPLFHRMGFLMMDELGPEGIVLLRPRPNPYARPAPTS